MIDAEKSIIYCPKCGGELQSSITGFFYPKELKILRIFGGLLIAGYLYIMLFTSFGDFSNSGAGKSLVIVPVLIIAAITKIGVLRKEVQTCSKCQHSNLNEQL
ncbi:MAG: hypothetical protein V4445_05490 [Pseudomonadota bacterium]